MDVQTNSDEIINKMIFNKIFKKYKHFMMVSKNFNPNIFSATKQVHVSELAFTFFSLRTESQTLREERYLHSKFKMESARNDGLELIDHT